MLDRKNAKPKDRPERKKSKIKKQAQDTLFKKQDENLRVFKRGQ